MDKLELCIQQHGQSARTYADRAIVVDDVCLLPNFDVNPSLLKALDGLFKSGLINDYPPISDVKIFTQPKSYRGFDKELISTRKIAGLFEFCTHLYPQNLSGKLGQYYWDELDIYRRAESLDSVMFSSRIRDMFGYQGYPEGYEEQAEQVERFIKSVRQELCAASSKITMYCMVDDNEYHCRFAPYIFVGSRCLLVIARMWEL